MLSKKNTLAIMILVFAFTFAAPLAANAKGNEYKQIVRHLKTKYKAKKVKIPFMFLARMAVSIVRPAGVKSFSVTLFEDLKFSKETLDTEMQTAMRNSFDESWSPVFRVRSRDGQQAYMYMSDAGKDSVKIALVTIDKEQAAVIRATINPDKLAEFMDNPRIFGISLDDGKKTAEEKEADQKVIESVNPKKEAEKTEQPKEND